MTQATSRQRRHILLSFAHRGEAKAFLQEMKWTPLNKEGELYSLNGQKENAEEAVSLVITGEGREQVLIKLSTGLTLLKERYPNDEFIVLNLGVCGHLLGHPQRFDKEEIVSVKTCYSQKGASDEEMEFKSFTTLDDKNNSFSSADIVSSNIRVLDSSNAERLSHFAPLVDREIWATGLVCHELNTPFASLKVVSDFADGDICVRVKDDTDRWSDLLLRAFYHWQESNEDFKAPQEELWPELHQNLHITVSQERRLKQLLKALKLKGKSKEEVLKSTSFEEIIAQDIRPKDKTKLFLEALTDFLNPLEKKLREELNQVTSSLKEAGFNVRFDQGHESEVLHLTSSLERETQINKMIAALESFNFNKFRQLLRGEESSRKNSENV